MSWGEKVGKRNISIGTILNNTFAGIKNPTKVGVYVGNNTVMCFIGYKYELCKYDRNTIEEFEILEDCVPYNIFVNTVCDHWRKMKESVQDE